MRNLAPVLSRESGVFQTREPTLVVVGAQQRCVGLACSNSCELYDGVAVGDLKRSINLIQAVQPRKQMSMQMQWPQTGTQVLQQRTGYLPGQVVCVLDARVHA